MSLIRRQSFGAGAAADDIPGTGNPDHAGDTPRRTPGLAQAGDIRRRTRDLAQAKPGDRRRSPH
ncbi:hypothetical protein ACWDOR_40565 [Streptosporangium canum]|uniref:hypothetical protein n=1 Tax=Streptosporangium canum TaxID=324952 RepID=UPI0036B20AA1